MRPKPLGIPALAALLAAGAGGARAELPGPISQFGNLPCLAPLVRSVDPLAPKNIGEALLLPPYRALPERAGVGEVRFPISGVDAAAQRAFDRGVALLHGFDDAGAERCFREAASRTPGHPMPYWGMAEANSGRPAHARIYANYASHLAPAWRGITERELGWIRLSKRFYEKAGNEAERRGTRIATLERMALADPDAPEPGAFLLRALVQDERRAGLIPRSRLGPDSIAGRLLDRSPDHPAAHYRPLLWIRAAPDHAASIALLAAEVAPRSPGAWRVAAECFAAAGRPAETLRAQTRALHLDLGACRADLAIPDAQDGFVAAASAHLESLIATGQTRAATEFARHLITLPQPRLDADAEGRPAPAQTTSRMTGRRQLATALMRAGKWGDLLAACAPGGDLGPGHSWADRAHSLYWRGIAARHLGDGAAADAANQSLEQLFRQFLSDGTTAEVERELAAVVKSARAHAAIFAAGADALPPREPMLHMSDLQLARLLTTVGSHASALEIARAELDRAPTPEATATYCSAAVAAGRPDEALPRFDLAFRRNAALADRDHTLFGEAMRPYVERLGLRGNWRLPPPPDRWPAPLLAADASPVRWLPPDAPAFALSRADGTRASLADYAGRPVVVMFFVGVGCPFCIEQMRTFADESEAFRAAGIEMLAVSTDSLAELRESAAARHGAGAEGALPFPVLADPELEAFRDYGCVDDFNDKALHGTFLIGPGGQILWSDRSHEPFLAPGFLLAEADRMLQAHPADPPTR